MRFMLAAESAPAPSPVLHDLYVHSPAPPSKPLGAALPLRESAFSHLQE